jgi:hypothetical protein
MFFAEFNLQNVGLRFKSFRPQDLKTVRQEAQPTSRPQDPP